MSKKIYGMLVLVKMKSQNIWLVYRKVILGDIPGAVVNPKNSDHFMSGLKRF
jgi:hypothetical protein